MRPDLVVAEPGKVAVILKWSDVRGRALVLLLTCGAEPRKVPIDPHVHRSHAQKPRED